MQGVIDAVRDSIPILARLGLEPRKDAGVLNQLYECITMRPIRAYADR
jgi:hypothetical protein